MPFEKARGVRLVISRAVLDAVFDECDRYDDVETGGRIIGTYDRGRALHIHVSGMIDAGPKAQRARTSFFQDGDYQEKVFRSVENEHPAVEHLGTWHTHHVNGYPHLSDGDLKTYRKTVNHPSHNLDFWYALLVTEKVRGRQRYLTKHYLFRRDDPVAYEIPERRVAITSAPVLWVPSTAKTANLKIDRRDRLSANAGDRPTPLLPEAREQRAFDDHVLRRLFPSLKPFLSKTTGTLSWKGTIELVDFTTPEVVVRERLEGGSVIYEATTAESELPHSRGTRPAREETPWLALKALELTLNRAVPRRNVRKRIM